MKYTTLLLTMLYVGSVEPMNNEIKVLIVDTGIAPHSDLTSVQYDYSDNYVDRTGHGTHIAGIVALGKDLNDPLCPEVKIHSCKYYDYFAELEGISNCMKRARRENFDYVNISSNGPGYIKAEHQSFRQYKGEVYVAAGNNGEALGGKVVYYPSAYRYKHNMTNVHMVQAVCKTCSYSNTHKLAIKEYGDYIKSTFNDGKYQSLRGTSQATAIAMHKALKLRCAQIKGALNGNR